MKIIDEDIYAALLHFKTRCKSNNSEMGRRLDLSRDHVGKIINKKLTYIEDKTWERIHPIIAPYIDAVKRSNVRQVTPNNWVGVKVISLAAADTLDNNTLYEETDEYSTDVVYFPDARYKDFAVKIVGDSMSPWYPCGTIVLCRECMPKHGDRVVVQQLDGGIIFKIFAIKDNNYYLLSINNKFGGKDLVVDDNVIKIYPIIQSLRNERDIDSEMAKHSIKQSWKKRLDIM